jgi:hypothetical protein
MGKSMTQFDMSPNPYVTMPYLQDEKLQEAHGFTNDGYSFGVKSAFGQDPEDPVGDAFFHQRNIRKLQKMIRNEVSIQTNNRFKLEEDQDESDLLVAMRAVYMEYGKYIKKNVAEQIKVLNDKLIEYIMPQLITEIKQYYGYLKDINEPLKPIDRPMNVSNAGRRTLPSVTTTWTR